jgi:aspartyl-tRNA(Asn)/glutamyl-tRNA(Gln) amidotransferase subunit A
MRSSEPGALAQRLYQTRSLVASAADISAGKISCEELTEQCLHRLGDVEPAIRAYLSVDDDAALLVARQLDREMAEGHGRGALHGIPIAVKDVIDVEGMPTTAGSKVLAKQRSAIADSAIIRAFRSAGAVIIGKTNTHEFAYGALTPPTRNPLDTRRIAGGSSGGSAAAVASGSAVVGVGTDTGGSVRLPAALCGVAGFRPRRTPVADLSGIIALAPEFDQWGLMAASAEDLEIAWRTLSGTQKPPAQHLRIVAPLGLDRCLPMIDESVTAAFESTLSALAGSGFEIRREPLPNFVDWQPPRMAVQMSQALEVHRRAGWWPAMRDSYSDEVRRNLEVAEEKGVDLDGARRRLGELDGRVDELLRGLTVIAVPTVPIRAPLVSDVETLAYGAGARHPIVGLLAAATLPFSRNDLASIAVPCWPEGDDLPASIQFAAPDESLVFAAARAVPWRFS